MVFLTPVGDEARCFHMEGRMKAMLTSYAYTVRSPLTFIGFNDQFGYGSEKTVVDCAGVNTTSLFVMNPATSEPLNQISCESCCCC